MSRQFFDGNLKLNLQFLINKSLVLSRAIVLKKGVHRTIEEKMSAGNNVSVLVGGIHSQGSFKNYEDTILIFFAPPPLI